MGRRQHFVPQFLLRNFSSDPRRKSIALYYLPESRIIRGASIKEQAYKKRIYAPEKEIEEYLSLVEGKVSVIIQKIIREENISLGEEEDVSLKHLVSLQLHRTPEKAQTIDEMAEKVIKTAFRHDPRIKDHINDFSIHLTSPYLISIGFALRLTPALFDLKVSLLINSSIESVMLGQHPAIIANQFLYEKKWIASRQGIGAKGALVLLPISPRHVLALYDRDRYAIADFAKNGILSKEDVTKINLFQFCYTTDCVYFFANGDKVAFDKYKTLTKEFREGDRNITRVFEGGKEKGKNSERIVSSSKDPPLDPTFTFLRLKLHAIREDLGPTSDISRDWVKKIESRLWKPKTRDC